MTYTISGIMHDTINLSLTIASITVNIDPGSHAAANS